MNNIDEFLPKNSDSSEENENEGLPKKKVRKTKKKVHPKI